MNYSGKHTPEEYEKARLYRAAYCGNDSWEEIVSHDNWVHLYHAAILNKTPDELKARQTADKQYEERNPVKSKTPNTYSFVSAKDDVDVLRIISEAPKGSPFILIEIHNRAGNGVENKVSAFLLVHTDLTTDPRTRDLTVYIGTLKKWDIETPWFADLTKTSYFGHDLFLRKVSEVREQIAQVMKALSPKDSRTTVTVYQPPAPSVWG
jgi:hypothetical protein